MKILFLHNSRSTFVQIDEDILASENEVRELCCSPASAPWHFLRDMIVAVKNVFWANIIFSWFGGYYALLPFLIGRMFGRKCVVVVSGYDIDSIPELKYGNMRAGIRRAVGISVLKLANKVLAVSNFSYHLAVNNAEVPEHKLLMIYHGLDISAYPDSRNMHNDRQGVVTISIVKYANLSIKGLTNFVKTAACFKDIPFYIVGPWVDDSINYLKSLATENVVFTGPIYGKDLIGFLLTKDVYAQLSATESFCFALAESMLCGCVPVATDRGALPEVAGELGYYAPYGDIQATAEAITQALAADPGKRDQYYNRIAANFPLHTRREQILQVIRNLT